MGFGAQPSTKQDSKCWLAEESIHIELGSSAKLWNMRWKQQLRGCDASGTPKNAAGVPQEKLLVRSRHVKGMIV